MLDGDALNFNLLMGAKLDPGLMRPWIGSDGKTYITMNTPQGLKTQQIAAYGTLRRDQWKELDRVVLETAKYRLTGIQDLIDNNLVLPLANPLAVIELETHRIKEAMSAIVSMEPAVRGPKDRPVYDSVFIPIPIVHADFSIGRRPLEASKKWGGNSLETDSVRLATDRVSERLEEMLFGDETYAYARGTIYSYVNFPDRSQVTLVESWETADPEDILADVQAMIRMSLDSRHYGPWILYIPPNCATVVDRDYTNENGGMTIRERLLKIESLQDIKMAPLLADDNYLLVEMQPTTVRLIRGMDPTPVQWQTNGGFVNEYKVLAILVPEIRSDAYGRCGIVHLA